MMSPVGCRHYCVVARVRARGDGLGADRTRQPGSSPLPQPGQFGPDDQPRAV